MKPLPLGRWRTDKPIDATMRMIDLANCDSCGTCNVPKEKDTLTSEYIFVEGDEVDLGYMPLPGSFELHRKN